MFKVAIMETGQALNHLLIVQHLPTGDHDLTDYGTVDAAVDAAFADARHADAETPDAELRKQVEASIDWYYPEEALKAAQDGYDWPLNLGFIIEDGSY